MSFPWLLDHPNFSLEILLTQEEELKRFDGNTNWRRKGWAVVERRLLAVSDRVLIGQPADLMRLVPDELPEPFTTADLAASIGRPRRVAQQMAYCLRETGLVEVAGKLGNTILYSGGA